MGLVSLGSALLVPLSLTSFQSTKLNPPLAIDPPATGGDVRSVQVSPDGRYVLYTADEDAVNAVDLYCVPADGSAAPFRLSRASAGLLDTDSTDVGTVLISPDSRWVAFRGLDNQAHLHQAPVAVPTFGHAAPSGGSSPVTGRTRHPPPAVRLSTTGSAVAITSDSAWIAYVSGGDDLYVIRSHGRGVARLVDTGIENEGRDTVRASPDGRWLVYRHADGVRAAPIDGSAPPVAYRGPDQESFQSQFEISADSSFVVLKDTSPSGSSLFVAPIDASAEAVPILANVPFPGIVVWQLDPTGRRVVYSTDESYPPQAPDRLRSVPVDGSGASVLLVSITDELRQLGDSGRVGISPDGEHVVFRASLESETTRVPLYTVPISGGTIRRLGPSADGHAYRMKPDSSGIVFIAGGALDRLYSTTFSGAYFELSSSITNAEDVVDFALSPDGERVLYRADRDVNDVFELFAVPIDGGASTKVSAPLVAGGDVSAVWTIAPDSERVLYVADHEVDSVDELVSAPLLEGPPAFELNGPLDPGPALGDVRRMRITPDGTGVIYEADGEHDQLLELHLAPIGGGAVTKLNGDYVDGGNLLLEYDNWQITPDGQHLLYVATQERLNAHELYAVPLDPVGAPWKLNHTIPVSFGVGGVKSFDVTSDGARVIYTAYTSSGTTRTAELWASRVDGSGTPVRISAPDHDLEFDVGDPPIHEIDPTGVRAVYRAGANLYSAPLDASAPPLQLNPTLVPGGEVGPSFTDPALLIDPTGHWVIFAADALVDSQHELFRVSSDGSEPGATATRVNDALLPNADVNWFTISPDGERILYVVDQLTAEPRYELFSAPLDGNGPVVRLSEPAPPALLRVPNELAFTPDGSKVLFVQDGSSAAGRLLLVPCDGSAAPLELATGADHLDVPVVDPLGVRVAFSRNVVGNGADLFSVALDGSGGEVQLDLPSAGYASSARRLRISPDGIWAVYVADELVEDTFELFARRLDGSGSPIQLSGPMAGDLDHLSVASVGFAIAPGSTRVVYGADQDTLGVNELYSSPLP